MANDLPILEEIRQVAFAPVFASFRAMLGDELYELVQEREDDAQSELLASLLVPGSSWEVHVAEVAGVVVGFVAFQLDWKTGIGGIRRISACLSGQAGQSTRTRPAWGRSISSR